MNSQFIADTLAGAARLFCGATVRLGGSDSGEDWLGAAGAARQRVYFANHSSHLDFIVLWSALPPELRRVTRPVAARDYWEKSALRRFLAREVYQAVLIERDHVSAANNPIRQMVDAMGDEFSLILFPEGTRGSGDAVAPFKSGIYHLAAKKPGLECVPVYIENLNRVLPKGEFLPLPLLSSVSLGNSLYLESGEAKTEFLARLHAAVVALKQP